MNKKKFIAAISVVVMLCGGYLVLNGIEQGKDNSKNENISTAVTKESSKQTHGNKKGKTNNINTPANAITDKKQDVTSENIKHADLFSTAPSSYVPLSAIAEITNLPENIQNGISKIISSYNGILMLKRTKDKVVIIAENPENIRHGIDFIEISIPNGHQTVNTLGYNGKIKDAENDIWEYNQNQLPLKHIKYSKNGDAEFIETWNYEADNPIKYEMKNADGKTLSMRKETLKDGTDMRIEHLIYDTNGNTKVSISTTYEGADVKRFTYYNADKPNDGESIFSEYSDGMKTKEVVYTSDLKIKNTFQAHYKDGNRDELTVLDNSNNKIEDIKNIQE